VRPQRAVYSLAALHMSPKIILASSASGLDNVDPVFQGYRWAVVGRRLRLDALDERHCTVLDKDHSVS
jgi:hypothetical protein